MKIIRDHYDRLCVLGKQTEEPPASWKQLQRKPVTDNPTWYSAYPLDGGAICAQEGTFKIVGDVTDHVIDLHFKPTIKGGKGSFNPAAETVIALWEEHKAAC